MKSLLRILFTLFVLSSAYSSTAQDALRGVWDTGQENTKIEIKADNGIYKGKIVSSDNSNAKVGTLILKEVKSVGGEWKGKLYSPQKEKWFDAVLKVKGKKLSITVKAGLSSKTVEWTKK